MCGIVGHVTGGGAPDRPAVLSAMRRLAHRGPDGQGIVDFANACLGHKRLSIIDLAGSVQPMSSADGRYTIVFNGEIYNYLELRQGLLARGVEFATEGDTEVLLHLYIMFGESCLSQLNGMFAFAVWDDLNQILFAARDRVGEKPFYYSKGQQQLAFASEIGALLEFPWVDRAVDARAIDRFFALQYVGGEGTIYRGIQQLRPGHCLIHGAGSTVAKAYWSPPFPDPSPRQESQLREELVSLMDDAVRLRLRSDVPLGAFLSGGLDSSIVVASMRKHGSNVLSFAVGFGESSFDETEYSRQAAGFFGTSHRSEVLDWNIEKSTRQALNYFGEPFADPSGLPTWHLCGFARQYVTVALSGDGADELFGGYRRYYARQQIGKWLAVPKRLRKLILEPLIARLPESDAYFTASNVKKLKLFVRLAEQLERSSGSLAPQTFSLMDRQRLFNNGFIETEDADFASEFGLRNLDPVSQMMLADIQTYLSDDILVKLDRMSMAFGLEARAPFLDHRLVEFACRLPLSWKIRGGRQKYLLRESFRDRLPPSLVDRSKHGFSTPLGLWFRGPLKGLFEELVLSYNTPDYLNRMEIEAIWFNHLNGKSDNGFKLWSLLVFHHWLQRPGQTP